MKVHTETIEHIKVAEFLRQCTDLKFYHFPNEGKRSLANGKILKRMGMVAGVSDFFFPKGNENKKGLWLELKTETGKATPAQRQFIKDMIDEGYDGCFAYGAEEAIALIRDFYSI